MWENDITMGRVQTVIRLQPELMARVRRQAHRENRSVNSFIEQTLDRATQIEFPKLPPDFKISDEIAAMGGCIGKPSLEDLENDPKLAYLWERYGE